MTFLSFSCCYVGHVSHFSDFLSFPCCYRAQRQEIPFLKNKGPLLLFISLSHISQLHMFLIAAHATKFVNSCTCNYVGYKYSHSIVTKIINFTFFQNGMTAWLLICCHSIAKLSLHPLHLESYHISVHFWTPTIAHLIFFQKSVQDFCHHGGDNFFHLVLCNLYTHWRKQFYLQRNKQWTRPTKIYL